MSSMPTINSSGNSKPTTKRRRIKPNNPWRGLFKKNGTMEDLVVVSIQIVCIALLMGCAIALLFKSHMPWTWNTWSEGGVGDAVTTVATRSSFFTPFLPQRGAGGGAGSGPSQKHGKFKLTPLKPSKIYTIPDSMSHIGDKSDEYAKLRKTFDAMDLPPTVQAHTFETKPMDSPGNDQVAYDVHNCPDEPPHGYPYHWDLVDILKDWPTDDPTPPSELHQGLCVFDYTKDYDKAMTYRTAEVPFVVQNDPQVALTAARWTHPGYMQQMLGDVMHRAEYSVNNHFMYWNPPPKNPRPDNRNKNDGGKNPRWEHRIQPPSGWKEPTKMIRMTYDEWVDHANVTEDKLGSDQPHWYFRLIGCGETGPEGQCDAGSSENLFDELPFFQPKPNLYIVDPTEQKGIHCRFGMSRVIAENHFDGSRNAIVVLGGERRYILSHPDQCQHLALYPKSHPSARHSAIDWSNPDLKEFPEFSLAKGNEVVLQAGDVLYLPTNWFHYIVSLSLNFQCNTRSGITKEYFSPIKACGF
jgi:hypothetical protein